MKFKKFKSVDGEPKRIALTTGHVYLIGNKWTDIPELAWRLAYAEGCISEEFVLSGNKEPTKVVAGKELLMREAVDVIKSWIKDNKTENFTKTNNLPNVFKLREALGSDEIDNKFRDTAFITASEELEDDAPTTD